MEKTSSSYLRFVALSLLGWIVVAIISLKCGAVDQPGIDLILELRLPRVLLASIVGMALAVSGAVLQTLFANPLSEPYTLGISSGSALGAVIGLSVGLELQMGGLAGTAVLGALFFTALLYFISWLLEKRGDGLSQGSFILLLSGMMLGLLGSSLVALWIAMSDQNGIQSALSWLFGDLSRARMDGLGMLFGVTAVLIFGLWRKSQVLDTFLLGEEVALGLGVPVVLVRRKLILWVCMLIGISVSAAGMIGFVGLVVPHFSRRMVGALHRKLIPACAIWGATVLVFADCLSRVCLRPNEIPVGIVTSLAGAPLFLWILLKERKAA